jgi:diacylglycerol kinase family enzyme
VTRAPGEARRLAADAATRGAGVVVAVGGDGTAGEVASALAGGPTVLAPVSAGSTNVFARSLGWPAAPGEAVAALGPALARGAWREVIIGRVRAGPHDRSFCVNAGVGLDAETVVAVESRPAVKRRLRQAGFALAVAATAARLSRSEPILAVSADGALPARLASLVAACGSPYAYLGRRRLDLVPGASYDGTLRWVGMLRLRPHEVARILAGALDGGRHLDHSGVVHGRARQIAVQADPPAAVQCDGEPLGWHPEVLLTPGRPLRTLLP